MIVGALQDGVAVLDGTIVLVLSAARLGRRRPDRVNRHHGDRGLSKG